MDKQSLRKIMLAKRQALDKECAVFNSAQICRALLAALVFRPGCKALAYAPIRGEVDLSELLAELESIGVEVLMPRVVAPGIIEAFYCPPPWHQNVVSGAYGIREPLDCAKHISPEEIDLVLTPGVAFDWDFYRLGYGGGYYDRYMARLSTATLSIGVAYSLQVVPQLPHDDHDCQVDALVSEEGLLWRGDWKACFTAGLGGLRLAVD